MNPFRWPFRAQYFAGFIVCVSLMTYAYYEQFAMAVEPCPLCIFQRIVVIVMGIVFLVGAIQNPGPSGRRIYGILELLTAFVGVNMLQSAFTRWCPLEIVLRKVGVQPGC